MLRKLFILGSCITVFATGTHLALAGDDSESIAPPPTLNVTTSITSKDSSLVARAVFQNTNAYDCTSTYGQGCSVTKSYQANELDMKFMLCIWKDNVSVTSSCQQLLDQQGGCRKNDIPTSSCGSFQNGEFGSHIIPYCEYSVQSSSVAWDWTIDKSGNVDCSKTNLVPYN